MREKLGLVRVLLSIETLLLGSLMLYIASRLRSANIFRAPDEGRMMLSAVPGKAARQCECEREWEQRASEFWIHEVSFPTNIPEVSLEIDFSEKCNKVGVNNETKIKNKQREGKLKAGG